MSLFEKIYHNIVYGKIDFKISILPLYMRKSGNTKMLVQKVSNALFLVLNATFYSEENLSTKRLTY